MAEKIQTITEIHNQLRSMFAVRWSHDEARAMATLIIEEYTGVNGARQLAFGSQKIDTPAATAIITAAERAAACEPLQYIFGYTTFCGHKFMVAPGVLIPRPETEEMTEMIIMENKGFKGIAVDLGSGSGCIAVSLSLALQDSSVYAIDNSESALLVTGQNAALNHAMLNIIKADILRSPVRSFPECDMIISNPPYVRESEKAFMHGNVLDFEPYEALFVPDNDPLIYYKRIAEIAKERLHSSGRIYLEINEALADDTTHLFDNKHFNEIIVCDDIRGKKRILKARKNE